MSQSIKVGPYEALVDDEDFESISRYTWHPITREDRSAIYAATKIAGKNVYMHRMILNYPASGVDHRDRNGLNNQRENLRIATQTQNQMNTGPTKRNKLGLKGVTPSRGKFQAQIGHGPRVLFLGRFETSKEAALAYDKKAFELHGDFAYLNFPKELNHGKLAVSVA